MNNFFSLFSLLLVVSLTSCGNNIKDRLKSATEDYTGTCSIEAGKNDKVWVVDGAFWNDDVVKVWECECEDGKFRTFFAHEESEAYKDMIQHPSWQGKITFAVSHGEITKVLSRNNGSVITGTATVDENGTIIIE